MDFTYDLTGNIGKVRMHIQDNVEADAHFKDPELQVILDNDELASLSGSRLVFAASGLALLIWSALLGKEDERVQTGSWAGDRRDVAGKMRKLAQSYFDLAGFSLEAAPVFLSVPFDFSPFVAAEREVREESG